MQFVTNRTAWKDFNLDVCATEFLKGGQEVTIVKRKGRGDGALVACALWWLHTLRFR